jgi:hypothetical protein
MRRLDARSCSSRERRARRMVLAALMMTTLLAGAGDAAVLVELFTAQGCSSCPPADRLLTAMGSDPDLGKQVVPLAFHVTYWNTDAWRDRFSDAAWTKRQKEYVIAARGERIYTPQMVIGGGVQCVGSDVECIRAGVEAAAAKAQGAVSVVPAVSGGEVAVTVTAQAPAGQKSLDVMVALFESGLDTDVRGGENAQKTLRDDYVVRRLQRAFKVSGEGQRQQVVTLELEPEWQRGKLGVAAFLQDPKTHQVFGAASAQLP